MRGHHVALAVVILLTSAQTVSAQDNPWRLIKRLFHEPATVIINELEGSRGKTFTPAKPKPAKKEADKEEQPASKQAATPEAPKEQEQAAAPIPRARPDDESGEAGTDLTRMETTKEEPAGMEAAAIVEAAPTEKTQDRIETDTAGTDVAADPAADADATRTNVVEKPTTAETEASTAEAAEPDATDGPAVAEAETPIPRPRPEIIASYAPNDDRQLSGSAAAIGALTSPGEPLVRPPPAATSTCGAELARLGVDAAALAPINEGRCGVRAPVALASLGGGATELTAKAITECQMAESFANWIREEVQPRAEQMLGGDVTGLRVAASYDCRNRNGLADAKLSEHAKGNAIDISAFEIEGHGWVSVGGGHKSKEARFLKEVRKSACGPFKTVLGPGSDSYHSDHFHLDLAKRNTRGPSKGLYCR